MEQLLETGKIVTLHALKGEVKVEPWCDSPELLAEFDELYLDGRWVNVERARVQKRMVIMKLEGYDTPEEAANFQRKGPVHVYKVGRNDPCPCGSGKKYKKCCGR